MKLSKLSPRAGARLRIRFDSREFCYPGGLSQELPGKDYLPAMSFLQAWFENDSTSGRGGKGMRVNWGAVCGMALSLAVSASFWTGVVVMVERIWK
jgi:hypothetical protein